jgi:hypothetical protein
LISSQSGSSNGNMYQHEEDERQSPETTSPDVAESPGAVQAPPGEGADRPRRILVVADERFSGGAFADELRSHLVSASEQVEVFVIAPSLAGSAIEHEMADVDGPRAEAAERLEWILGELREVGIEAAGEVGDADPTVAVGDGLREFPADEIVVIGHADDEGRTYAEKNLWNRLKRDFSQPMTAIMVAEPAGEDAPGEVVSIEHESSNHHLDEDEFLLSRNFPPLRRRDIAGILVGILGTITLGLIAVAAGLADDGDIQGASAAVLLIAIGSFLLNVAHVVGLVFFQSVRYDGVWEKFLARSSMAYTAVGVPVALALWLLAT